MDLVVQMYRYENIENNPQKQQRQNEINFCLQENASRPYINRVHIIISNTNDKDYFSEIVSQQEKLKFFNVQQQPTYEDIFRYIKDNIDNDTIVCVMNSDIFLDPTLPFELVYKNIVGKNMFGLTRHEYSGDTHEICNSSTCSLIYNFGGSCDAFIVKTPLAENLNLEKLNFVQNVWGSEAILQKHFFQAGYNIVNPCFQIKIFHVHKGGIHFHDYQCIGTHKDFMKSPSYI